MCFKRLTVWAFPIALCLAFVLAGCGSGGSSGDTTGEAAAGGDTASSTPAETTRGAEGGVVKIGLLAPLTGGSAADGDAMKKGAELAVQELNDAGGVAGYTFELEAVDTQDLKADAVAAGAQQFISDPDVGAVVTSYASANNFEIETFADAKMPYIVAANSDQTEEIISKDPSKYTTVWSLVPSYEPFRTELPKVIEQWAAEGKLELRNRKAFVITSDNPFSAPISEGLIKTLESMGWTVAPEEIVPYGAVNDWGAILAKVREFDPDLIINTDYLPANEATFMKQFLANPTDSVVFLQYGPNIPEFLELTKDDSTGVIYDLLGDPIYSPNFQPSQELLAKLEDAYGAEVSGVAMATYEAVQLYAGTLAQVGDPAKKEEIGELIGKTSKDFFGGHLEFDPQTHLAKFGPDLVPIQFLQIVDGERVLLLPEKYATGEFQLPPWME